MLYRTDSAELSAKAKRLTELADRREGLPEQRSLMASLGASRRLVALRPLACSWACATQIDGPEPGWSASFSTRSTEASKTASQALAALGDLLSSVSPSQYNQLDQALRAGGEWSHLSGGAWSQLSPRTAIDSLPDSGELRCVGLAVLSCHRYGHIREAALRQLSGAPLARSLPFLLVRANDWVRQVRTVAHARLLALDEDNVEGLAPLLELVQQLASQGRREPGAVEHLLNLLRTPRGLAAVQDMWTSSAPSLRRAAVRFSFHEGGGPEAVLQATTHSHDAQLRRWAVEMLSASGFPSRFDTFRRLSRDPNPMVATAALDALDGHLEPRDVELLKELRLVPSPGLQHTARFMLEKHFGEKSHRRVYLPLIATGDERSLSVAAIGLSATGEPEDHGVLLSARLGARSKPRQQLLGAAAILNPVGARPALLEDVEHHLRGVSKAARKLLAERVLDADAGHISVLQDSRLPHVRINALLLAARLSHWVALPLILRATRDPDSDAANEASRLLKTWLTDHFHGIYRPPDPTETQRRQVRAELAASSASLDESATENLERALAGENAAS